MTNQEEILRYAGFWPRLLAHNIDLLPILGLFYLSTFIPIRGYDLFILGGIYLLYHTIFELSNWQATPGKRWVGIHVKQENEPDPSPIKIILRNALKGLSLLLFFSGFFMIFFHPKKQALHDYIVGALVLFRED